MLLLLGSKALRFYVPELTTGPDIDILGDYNEIVSYMNGIGRPNSIYPISNGKKLVAKYNNGTIVEAEIDWGHSSPHMALDIVTKGDEVYDGNFIVPPLDFLYTLKMSHRYLRNSPHFLKTMEHIHLMRSRGAKIRPEYKEFLIQREKETYNYGHPKLNVTRRAFFADDGINYIFDHDSIHEAMKHLDRPAYSYYSNKEVFCSKKLWEVCDYDIKLFGALEEIYVLALERSQIPFKNKIDPKKSFDMAAMKVCTSITSGWFREFCWENYHAIMESYDPTYVKRFWGKVDSGEVLLAKA